MESINRKTEMNVLRIWKVESRVETESLQTTNHKNEIESPESNYKMHFAFYRYTCTSLVYWWSLRIFAEKRSLSAVKEVV